MPQTILLLKHKTGSEERNMRAIASIAKSTATGWVLMGVAGSLAFLGCGKDENVEKRIVFHPKGRIIKEEWLIKRTPRGDTLLHGVRKENYWNGAAKQAVVWKEGKRDGSAQAWYENGALKWQKSYVEGKKEGTWRLYYKGGHTWMTVTYLNDALEGAAQVWEKADSDTPKEVKYAKGSCISGECAALDGPPITEDLAPEKKLELTRDREIIREFLD